MIDRRNLLRIGGMAALGATLPSGGALLALSPAGRRQVGRERGSISCDNASVPLSDPADRLSRADDFGAADAVGLTRDSFEGPYFFCADPPGRAIAAGRQGVPLVAGFRVVDISSGAPLAGAVVDIWHCDARGIYSGYDADPDLPAATGSRIDPISRSHACRGALLTDADGIAEFETIWPGHYAGRAIHIHFKVHLGNRSWTTNQTLMPEAFNARIVDTPSYLSGRATRRVPNAREARWGLPTMQVAERDGRLIGALNIGLREA